MIRRAASSASLSLFLGQGTGRGGGGRSQQLRGLVSSSSGRGSIVTSGKQQQQQQHRLPLQCDAARRSFVTLAGIRRIPTPPSPPMSSSSSSSSSLSVRAVVAALSSAGVNEGTAHKIQGAQLFVGSAIAFLCLAHRIQWRRLRQQELQRRWLSSSASGSGSGSGKKETDEKGGETEEERRRRKSMIYTRTGDRGTSSLYSGERRPKDDVTFEALGAADELNACIGIAKEYCNTKNGLLTPLSIIQSRLLDLGAAIATPATTSDTHKRERTRFDHRHVQDVERWIDELDGRLPPLKNFILPSGGQCAAHLHLARTVCRRAERTVVPLIKSEEVDAEVGVYLNRLSDFLFVAARWAAKSDGHEETVWIKP